MPSSHHEVLLTSETSGQLCNCAVWDPATGASLTTYRGSSTAPRTLSVVGQDYIVSAPPTAKPLLNVWQVNRSEQLPLRMFAPGKVGAMAVSPSGSYLLASTEENVTIWLLSTGQLLRVLSRHYQPVTVIRFSTDGASFVTAGADGQVLAWSLAVAVATRPLPGQESGQAGQPDPRWTWNEHALPVTDLHLGPGGTTGGRVFTASLDQTSKVYDLGSGQLLLSVSFTTPLTSVTADPLEDRVYLGATSGDIFSYSLLSPPRDVAVSSDTTCLDRAVMSGHAGHVTCLSLSLDGLTLASGGEDCHVRLWHLKSGQCTRVLDHKGSVSHVEFLVPPPAMLDGDQWRPTRRLVPLQKGTNEREPFVCSVLRREEVGPDVEEVERATDFYTVTSEAGGGARGGREKEGEEEMSVEELKQINSQLYKFAMKNVLHAK